MSITLDGTTGITTPDVEPTSSTPPVNGVYLPAANTIGLATNSAERVRIDSSGNLLFNSGYGSVATAYGCRAWVNFNGTGTVAIRASGNVSSITDNGTGDYRVNFSTAMPDANFAVTWECDQVMPYVPNLNATGSCSVQSRNGSNVNADCVAGYVAIFR